MPRLFKDAASAIEWAGRQSRNVQTLPGAFRWLLNQDPVAALDFSLPFASFEDPAAATELGARFTQVAAGDPALLVQWLHDSSHLPAEVRRSAILALCRNNQRRSPEWVFSWAVTLPQLGERQRFMMPALFKMIENGAPNVGDYVRSAPVTTLERNALRSVLEGVTKSR